MGSGLRAPARLKHVHLLGDHAGEVHRAKLPDRTRDGHERVRVRDDLTWL